MIPFEYIKPKTAKAAIDGLAKIPTAGFIAGGTNLVDLMKRGITVPTRLIDITALPLNSIEQRKGVIHIGALALNSAVAEHDFIKKRHPLLAMALNAGASAQIRNMATVGGNMMQRTRCPYFYDTALPCNKRKPGSGCGALEGYNRMHAIFGTSEACIAVHPSDMSVALAALDVSVLISGPKGYRRLSFVDFHRLPGDTPQKDNNLQKGELITGIEIPDAAATAKVYYLKIRDRSSYAFALVSVAAALTMEGNRISNARLAMGGVAHKPWRLTAVEKSLVGKPATEATFKEAAAFAMQGAKAYKYNAYKLQLAPNTILQALKMAAGLA